MCHTNTDCSLCAIPVNTDCVTKVGTVFDLISEHALISGNPPFFVLKKKKKIIIFIF